MVRVAVADSDLLDYLSNLNSSKTCTIGLILGQSMGKKDFVVHLAKTMPTLTEKTATAFKNIADIPDGVVADHAKHTTRMLPGGIYILGIFLVTEEHVLNPLSAKVKSILRHMHSTLSKHELLYGKSAENAEQLVLHYNKKSNTYTATTYCLESSTCTPAEFNFNSKDLAWEHLECFYEVNETVLITDRNLSIKDELKKIARKINNCLRTGIYLFNGQVRSKEDSLVILKKMKMSKAELTDAEDKPVSVSILMPLNCTSSIINAETVNAKGFLKITGLICSNVWLHPKYNFKKASDAIHEDIIRSLTSRLSMHFDSLTEGEGNYNDSSSIHEPPRRVLIPLSGSKVMLTDYLFPGEGVEETVLSLQDILDITIQTKSAIKDVEGPVDLAEYYNEMSEGGSNEVLPNMAADTNKFMYIIGTAIALLVLILSLLVHFLKD
ncbi:PREDICTED: protein odr-4 homolog [Nicrophorus vespilloides]|uniref:Protein odr-4 homolog n=1 Tax=Nicrophorus vespilloides TaxID=110193 RepID=A0ABM1MF20_NICVS|nr:PREDICTED: protein odr-4 homolog [Nicrophorus vespilloides]